MPSTAGDRPLHAGLVVGALGVVFGDIGTSPIYTVQTLFNPGNPHPVPINQANVYGVVSLIFWSVMVIDDLGSAGDESVSVASQGVWCVGESDRLRVVGQAAGIRRA